MTALLDAFNKWNPRYITTTQIYTQVDSASLIRAVAGV